MVVSLIGTRPQYIKVTPVDVFCRENGIDHRIIDTGQHYDAAMSSDVAKDLGLTIDRVLRPVADNKVRWCASVMNLLAAEITERDRVLVYGDTDSAFCAALVCYKKQIPFGHVEAGARCGNRAVPEEVNRQYIDSVAAINYCSARKDLRYVQDGLLVGDLEYELLNHLNPPTSRGDYVVMTLHRQENLNAQRVTEVFKFVEALSHRVLLPIHHSLQKAPWLKGLPVPNNLEILPAQPFTEMVQLLANCLFILTDSGSVPKTAPFFGKRCLVMRNEIGWRETIETGHVRLCTLSEDDAEWALERVSRHTSLYLPAGRPSSTIVTEISKS